MQPSAGGGGGGEKGKGRESAKFRRLSAIDPQRSAKSTAREKQCDTKALQISKGAASQVTYCAGEDR